MPSTKKLAKQYEEQLGTKQLWFGTIFQTIDATRMGKMLVHIPEITGTDTSADALFNCHWTSPFAGATQLSSNPDKTSEGATQSSYGMWMRPPDPGTQVVVGLIMINAIIEPVILSCLFHNYRNFMVPGMPASDTGEGPNPSSEININNEVKSHNVKYTYKGGSADVKSAKRPRAKIADNLFYQGLGDDFVRGQSTSGARREDNSEVFGILTPGSRKDGDPTKRNPGHQFVMDDNDANNLIRLRTGQGMQLLLNDTHDIIYIVNKKGTGYVEIDGDGNIDVFGKSSINLRTMGDLNLRADQNVNIEAGQDINIKAANNAPHPYDQSRGLGGVVDDIDLAHMDPMFGPDFLKANNKGTVNIEGQNNVNVIGKNLKFTAMPSIMGIAEGTDGNIDFMSLGPFSIQSQNVIATALGRASGGAVLPGVMYLQSTGATSLRGATQVVINSALKLDLEGSLVDIATKVTPPTIVPVLKPGDYIKTRKKKMTLFGFDTQLMPVPIPIPGKPTKQTQGKTPTGLGKVTQPGMPGIPAWEGLATGGVKTILTRVPQPEPSRSKKDRPFRGQDD
jgi:hypothetical protein